MTIYDDFLAAKHPHALGAGFLVNAERLPEHLYPWQRRIVQWALAQGRAALFEDVGLGKTLQQLAWAWQVCQHTDGSVLILAPLAVTHQTQAEGRRFGYTVTVCRSQSDVQPGINITNYDLLAKFDPTTFTGVVLDESSCLKAYMGKTKLALVEAFHATPYKLCCTATPAPNDHMEIGNHAEFLGIMPSSEMLARWFINDTMQMGTYRLKGHATDDFWAWVASWAVALRRPSDLGDYRDDGYDLPPLDLRHVVADVDVLADRGDQLFRAPTLNATTLHQEGRRTAAARAAQVAAIVAAHSGTWVVWCHTNYEADALVAVLPDAVELRGTEPSAVKERKLRAFSDGQTRILISKPEIAGFGLNWQHCHQTAFVGLSYSYEQFYQALGRFQRFGQRHPVTAWVVAASTEGAVLATIERKRAAHHVMQTAMIAASRAAQDQAALTLRRHADFTIRRGEDWTLYHGDTIPVTRSLPDASVDFTLFSPPFSNLYTYSDAVEDMGNAADDDEFFRHFDFLIPELHRVTRPGRLCAVHCKQLVNYKGRDGMAGLRDFRGEIIRHFTAAGWAYHSEVCIWTDPVLEMQRTKAHGLLYKQLRRDSSFSRQGLAEYLVIFRRWPRGADEDLVVAPVTHTEQTFPLDLWQRYASPVWFDINRTRVLNVEQARDDRDEKHLCPLQLDVIERALELWTNPGDVVLDPFAGIGSTGVIALQQRRRFIGCELKASYADVAERNLRNETAKRAQRTLFDALEVVS